MVEREITEYVTYRTRIQHSVKVTVNFNVPDIGLYTFASELFDDYYDSFRQTQFVDFCEYVTRQKAMMII